MPAANPRQQVDLLLRREEKLRRLAWVSLVIPFAIFSTFVVLVGKEQHKFSVLRSKNEQLDKQVKEKEQKLAETSLALDAVKSQHAGPQPHVTYYRSSIGNTVTGALSELGFMLNEKPDAARPALAGKPVDSIAYGCAVSDKDIRLIVAALEKANLPIRSIGPATVNPDPLLVQIVASPYTDPNGPSINPTAWKKTTPDCTAKKP